MRYQIQDKKGVIFSGELTDMSLAWDINMLNYKAFKKKYGNLERNPKWIIKDFDTTLQFVSILEAIFEDGETNQIVEMGNWFETQAQVLTEKEEHPF